MITLSADPGLTGALAILRDDVLVEVHDMPVLKLASGTGAKNMIDHAALADLFMDFAVSYKIDHCVIEKVATRPGEGAVGAFSFGKGYGALIQAVASQRVAYSFLTPHKWQRTVGLADGSDDAALDLAKRTWPTALGPNGKPAFGLKKHVGRADAALIGLAGWKLRRVG